MSEMPEMTATTGAGGAGEARERHRDLFTPEEATAYLHLDNVQALQKLRDAKLLTGFTGWARHMIYHRDDLDRCALRMCGRDPDAGKVKPKELRLAGQQ